MKYVLPSEIIDAYTHAVAITISIYPFYLFGCNTILHLDNFLYWSDRLHFENTRLQLSVPRDDYSCTVVLYSNLDPITTVFTMYFVSTHIKLLYTPAQELTSLH